MSFPTTFDNQRKIARDRLQKRPINRRPSFEGLPKKPAQRKAVLKKNSSTEPSTLSEEPLILSKKPYILSNEPYILSNKLYILM